MTTIDPRRQTMVNVSLTMAALVISGAAVYCASVSAGAMPRRVLAEQNRLRMSITGQGSPTVVFECLGMVQLEIWHRVQTGVSTFTRAVSYDHGGCWGSEPGVKPRDARQIALELRAALRRAGLPPPYILVGYSFGGPYVRVYAGMHPEEVAGIVLVDPTQEEFIEWLAVKFPQFNRISPKRILEQDEWGCQKDSMRQARESALPDVPMTLITGQRPVDAFTRHIMPRWLRSHQDWLKAYPHAHHIITTNSGHEVVLSDPELVIEAIRSTMERAEARGPRPE